MSNTHNLLFIGIARAPDKCVMASYTAEPANKSQYLNLVHQVLSAPDFAVKAAPHKRLRLVSENCMLNFTTDSAHRAYIVVTVKSYPERVCFALLEELQSKFLLKFGDSLESAAPDSLSKPSTKLFREIVNKYGNPSNVDALSRVRSQVDDVTQVMQGNVRQMLSNIEQTENLVENTANLQEKAGRYERGARQLKNTMRWRRIKMTMLITFIVVVIITVIALLIWQGNN